MTVDDDMDNSDSEADCNTDVSSFETVNNRPMKRTFAKQMHGGGKSKSISNRKKVNNSAIIWDNDLTNGIDISTTTHESTLNNTEQRQIDCSII